MPRLRSALHSLVTLTAALGGAALGAATTVRPAAAQALAAQPVTVVAPVATDADAAARPFAPGEQLKYDVR